MFIFDCRSGSVNSTGVGNYFRRWKCGNQETAAARTGRRILVLWFVFCVLLNCVETTFRSPFGFSIFSSGRNGG
jgi:hypothetical protein